MIFGGFKESSEIPPNNSLEATGMMRNLLPKLYYRDAGYAGDGQSPGASARVRYAARIVGLV
jgi:hypothetical protein